MMMMMMMTIIWGGDLSHPGLCLPETRPSESQSMRQQGRLLPSNCCFTGKKTKVQRVSCYSRDSEPMIQNLLTNHDSLGVSFLLFCTPLLSPHSWLLPFATATSVAALIHACTGRSQLRTAVVLSDTCVELSVLMRSARPAQEGTYLCLFPRGFHCLEDLNKQGPLAIYRQVDGPSSAAIIHSLLVKTGIFLPSLPSPSTGYADLHLPGVILYLIMNTLLLFTSP